MVKQQYQEVGDLGTVAKSCKSKQRTLMFGLKPKPLTVSRVIQVFREIAAISGSQSQKLKVDKIKKLLVAVQQSAETKYIIRGLQGKLRIGLAQSTVLISLAHALSFTIPETVDCTFVKGEQENENENVKVFQDDAAPIEKRLEAAVNMVKQAYSEVPSYDALLDAALKVPLVGLHEACNFHPGIPVAPMLAKPTKSIQEVLKRLNGLAFTCEFKYDGERAQIHKTPDGQLKVFSRSLLQTTAKYPEVPLFVEEAACENVDSFVLDAEVVAYNPKTGQLVPFQVLSTRKKTEESAETAKVQVIVQAFDLMYLNGKSLLNTKLEERRSLMLKHFLPVEGKFQYAKSLDFVDDGDTTALEQFLDSAVKGQCEGLMVKTMEDVYEPSRRSLNWLKLKKDYLEGLGDSLDLVPLGAYYGKGKRTGVYGAYLLACYDEDSEEFQSVCKVGTGFSDEALQTLSASLNEHKLEGGKSSQYNVADGLECDVWFDAVQVWEVKAADLSKSSLHRGAIGKTGEAGRGIGLRFPRFERIREDKKPALATTSDQILEMYYNQDAVKGQEDNGNGGDDDDDGI
jgi:DNA ligase-1